MSRCAPTNGPTRPEPSQRPPRSAASPKRVFVAHNLNERIQAATARATAAHGFQATTVADICAEAHVSQETFHKHFKDKQQAAIAALEGGVDQVMMDLRETFKAAPTWPEAIWDTFGAYLEWMAHEPDFSRLAIMEMMAAGEPGLELLQSLMDAFAMFLEPGYELVPDKAPAKSLVDEAVGNAVFGLLHEHIEREGPETLGVLQPELVRTILIPFLGAEAAGRFVAERSKGA